MKTVVFFFEEALSGFSSGIPNRVGISKRIADGFFKAVAERVSKVK